MTDHPICPICGGHHAFHSVRVRVSGEWISHCMSVTALGYVTAANSNFSPAQSTVPRRRLTLAESLARNTVRYKNTLAHLA